MIKEDDRKEFIGQIIDTFEDFLDEHGITPDQIENDERDDDNPAIIYGTQYDDVSCTLANIMYRWEVFKDEVK